MAGALSEREVRRSGTPTKGGLREVEILVVGAGISGLTLALCLSRRGHHPLVVEKAGRLRGGGYMIDFFGPGYDAAEALGLLPDLERIHYPIERLAFLGPNGVEKFSWEYRRVRRLFDDRHFNFLRGDLEELLYEQVRDRVEVRFGTGPRSIEQKAALVKVSFSDGTTRSFDAVVGADGLYSRIRDLLFGDARQFRRFLGHNTAAFMTDDIQLPRTREDAFLTMTMPGRQVAVYPVRGGRLAAFFLYRSPELAQYSIDVARAELNRVFGGIGWTVPSLLNRGLRSDDLYFDAVVQVEMPAWSVGRVALVGDACWCLSLLAGQGASMAMFGASVLAEELAAGGGIESALARYEERLRPVVARRQAAGRNMAAWFAPNTRLRLMIRDLLMRTATWPVASALFRRSLLLGGKT